MDVAAVVPAAGRSQRMGAAGDKLYHHLQDRPVLAHTLRALQAAADLGIGRIVVALAPGREARFEAEVRPHLLDGPPVEAVTGGSSRQESVLRALDHVGRAPWVLVHDGARPFLSRDLVRRCLKAALETAAGGGPGAAGRCVVAAVPPKDTIKVVDEHGTVRRTLDRARLWAVQTPQVFPTDVLRQAHRQALVDGFVGTDDAALVERLGVLVHIIPGDETNVKITTPQDLALAEFHLGIGRVVRDA